MSAPVVSAPATTAEIDDLRRAWKDAAMAPLWENKFAHRPPPGPEASYLWSWEKIDGIAFMTAAAQADR